jgi:curved DNA-binding protein
MDFKDYYATLGVAQAATQDEIKRAYRKLARKYHPDVSKEPDAEARFKEVAEAHEALIDPERRAAYDEIARRHASGQAFEPPPGWDSGYEYSGRGGMPRGAGEADFSDFFSSLFGRTQGASRGGTHRRHAAADEGAWPGEDHHARIDIELVDAYRGARRTISLRMPGRDAQGQPTLHERQLEVNIPAGVREGQHLRLAGQGAAGQGGAAAGDLYLEIRLRPDARFRVEGRDVHVELPLAPWEAALGATVHAPTPQGAVQLTIPPGSSAGRKLRLKGRGLPGQPAGDLYATLGIALPPADSAAVQDAWRALAAACPDFNPRAALEH